MTGKRSRTRVNLNQPDPTEAKLGQPALTRLNVLEKSRPMTNKNNYRMNAA